jgi:hypothetical protein
MKINEDMARKADDVKLADNYEDILANQPTIKNSDKYKDIIDILKKKPLTTNKEIATDYEKKRRPEKPESKIDSAIINQFIRKLRDVGIVDPLPEKTNNNVDKIPGVKGRPKITNDEIKMLGDGVLRKFAKGQTNFSDEEKDFITQLYNAATNTSEEEIDEVNNQYSINENRWFKIAGLL